ncbi:c-type cytochrome biogenesis protein CcmI [Methylobacterium sp. A54F]
MTAIWFILALMTAGAVLALLWPLSRRLRAGAPDTAGLATETGFYEDQLAEIERDLGRGLIAPDEAEAARTEAARRLLRASREGGTAEAADLAEPHLRQRRAASAFALSTIPLVALIAYGLYGSPNLPAQTASDRQAAQTSSQDLMRAVGQIEARLASDPDDVRGWAVLAPVYMRLGRFEDAARAYGAVARIKGEPPEVLAEWGEALVAAGNGTVPPEAKAIFERALARDPAAAKPRFYLARAAEQAGDTPEAIRQLTTLSEGAPADATWLPMVRQNLARLKGEPAPEAPPEAAPNANAAPAAGAPADQNAAIRGMVEGLDQRLAKQGGSPDEWLRLIRSRLVLNERDKARATLDRAREALGPDRGAVERLEAGARDLGLVEGAQGRAPGKPPTSVAAADPEARADTEAAVAAVKAMPAAERDAAIRAMVSNLDRRLAAKGGTADEWLRLVRSYSALGERVRASQTLDRARMALAADATAVLRLDGLARELDLHGSAGKP